jgi:hypothetical protein
MEVTQCPHDTTSLGKPLQEKTGFLCVEENVTSVREENPEGRWKESEDDQVLGR